MRKIIQLVVNFKTKILYKIFEKSEERKFYERCRKKNEELRKLEN
jgi:hypothetical protein